MFANSMFAGERVGCLFVVAGTEKAATNTQSVLEMLQRSEVSNPPAYGAKIASTILSDKTLKDIWYADLMVMSGRIRSMRRALYDALIQYGESVSKGDISAHSKPCCIGAPGTWAHLIRQSGMFGFLGLSPTVVQQLKGRSNVAICLMWPNLTSSSQTNIMYIWPPILEFLSPGSTLPTWNTWLAPSLNA
jgi:aspartate aminotransferase